MISAIVALVCGLWAIFGVFEPAMWRSGSALVSFACGLNTAIALVIMNGRRL